MDRGVGSERETKRSPKKRMTKLLRRISRNNNGEGTKSGKNGGSTRSCIRSRTLTERGGETVRICSGGGGENRDKMRQRAMGGGGGEREKGVQKRICKPNQKGLNGERFGAVREQVTL